MSLLDGMCYELGSQGYESYVSIFIFDIVLEAFP